MSWPGPGDREPPARFTSLPPDQLLRLTDELVRDPAAIRRWVGIDPAAPTPRIPTPAEIYRWTQILDDARELELLAAPRLGQYVRSFAGTTGAVIGFAFAFTGPVLGVPVAVVGLGFGVLVGGFAFWDTSKTIRDDLACGDRLRAIESAQEILRSMLP